MLEGDSGEAIGGDEGSALAGRRVYKSPRDSIYLENPVLYT